MGTTAAAHKSRTRSEGVTRTTRRHDDNQAWFSEKIDPVLGLTPYEPVKFEHCATENTELRHREHGVEAYSGQLG